MYGRVEVEVDADGTTLVLEFPGDQAFAMQMAEEPDMRELLQRALGAAVGFAPPVRMRLDGARTSASVGDDEPPTAASDAPAPDPAGDMPRDLKRELIESLGAEIVAERPAGTADEGDAPADEEDAELLGMESSDFGLKDPELFDHGDGEDDS
jgi:hypothetical protein